VSSCATCARTPRRRSSTHLNPPDEIACRFHHRLVLIHPFPNGNGRHARLLTDLLLEKVLRRPRFSWGGIHGIPEGDVRAAYLDALRAADKGDYRKFAEFARKH